MSTHTLHDFLADPKPDDKELSDKVKTFLKDNDFIIEVDTSSLCFVEAYKASGDNQVVSQQIKDELS